MVLKLKKVGDLFMHHETGIKILLLYLLLVFLTICVENLAQHHSTYDPKVTLVSDRSLRLVNGCC